MEIGVRETSELLLSKLEIWIWPLKAATFSRILFLRPTPVAMAMSIITTPMAIAAMAIFIIGAEILILCSFPVTRRLAINNSKFNECPFYLSSKVQFYCCFWCFPLARDNKKMPRPPHWPKQMHLHRLSLPPIGQQLTYPTYKGKT